MRVSVATMLYRLSPGRHSMTQLSAGPEAVFLAQKISKLGRADHRNLLPQQEVGTCSQIGIPDGRMHLPPLVQQIGPTAVAKTLLRIALWAALWFVALLLFINYMG